MGCAAHVWRSCRISSARTAFQELAGAARRRGVDRRSGRSGACTAACRSRRSARARPTTSRGAASARSSIEVIYPGVDTVGYTPSAVGARRDARLRLPRSAQAIQGRASRDSRVRGDERPERACSRSPARATIGPPRGAGGARLTSASACSFLGESASRRSFRLLRRAWALVFASPKEGWGITNLEAAACGTPVVASNSPGIRESVRDGETGFLVPHGDVPAMAAAMRRIAGSTRARRAAGRRGAHLRRDASRGSAPPTRPRRTCSE